MLRRAFKMAIDSPRRARWWCLSLRTCWSRKSSRRAGAATAEAGGCRRSRARGRTARRWREPPRLLAAARSPLLLVESGVARSEAVEEVVRLAELTGARVYQSWMSDVNFPVTHPQYLGDLDPTSPQAASVLGGNRRAGRRGMLAVLSRLPARRSRVARGSEDHPRGRRPLGDRQEHPCGLRAAGRHQSDPRRVEQALEAMLSDGARRNRSRAACWRRRAQKERGRERLGVRAAPAPPTPPPSPSPGSWRNCEKPSMPTP